MPIVEISGPALPQDAKDRLAKKITEIIAEEEKKAFKVDTTSITVVGFRDIPYQTFTLEPNLSPRSWRLFLKHSLGMYIYI